ncbi:MAG: hypothetical protein II897_03830 [Clostridia bacterium]|nr:hypothetical protein [Clostridia bacterium]
MNRLEINEQNDRLAVAAILVKNGYTVRQGKSRKGEKSKSYMYYIDYEKEQEDNQNER